MIRKRERPARHDIAISSYWDNAMRRELIELYFDGMDIEMLGWHFEVKTFEIFRELISLFFGVTALKDDPTAPRFGKRWECLEDSELIRLHRRGVPVVQIAEHLGRDPRGVAIRLINSWSVTCPPKLAKTLRLNEDQVEILMENGEQQSC